MRGRLSAQVNNDDDFFNPREDESQEFGDFASAFGTSTQTSTTKETLQSSTSDISAQPADGIVDNDSKKTEFADFGSAFTSNQTSSNANDPANLLFSINTTPNAQQMTSNSNQKVGDLLSDLDGISLDVSVPTEFSSDAILPHINTPDSTLLQPEIEYSNSFRNYQSMYKRPPGDISNQQFTVIDESDSHSNANRLKKPTRLVVSKSANAMKSLQNIEYPVCGTKNPVVFQIVWIVVSDVKLNFLWMLLSVFSIVLLKLTSCPKQIPQIVEILDSERCIHTFQTNPNIMEGTSRFQWEVKGSVEQKMEALFKKVQQRDPDQKEFLQAFREVLTSLKPVFERDVYRTRCTIKNKF